MLSMRIRGAFASILLPLFAAPGLHADTTFEVRVVARHTTGLIKKGLGFEGRETLFVKDGMMRMESRMVDPRRDVAPWQIHVYDARKQTILIIVPRSRVYSTRTWTGTYSPIRTFLVDREGPEITESQETKNIGGRTATMRSTRTSGGCKSRREDWVTAELEILRDLTAFDPRNGVDRVFLLSSTGTCDRDSGYHSLSGFLTEREVLDVNFDPIELGLFAAPAGFSEVPFKTLITKYLHLPARFADIGSAQTR